MEKTGSLKKVITYEDVKKLNKCSGIAWKARSL